MPAYTNSLIHESSPYLLQHAHNPVNWNPWRDELLDKISEGKKLLIISIGYAACHWCHVMEEESFEDEQVAEIMNNNYFNIKVDREERPDVDQVYMNAVQLMTGSGGWPMNIVALPDGRPVWGGTYFKKDQWKNALLQIADLYENDPEQLYEYAMRLEQGLKQLELIVPADDDFQKISKDELKSLVALWANSLDTKYGGEKRAPKFVVPGNWNFLLRYSLQTGDRKLKDIVINSLIKISYGGIYDHIGGGFSRYSVDERWHIPHFEKMLYDNAQLVSLYSKAYSVTKNPWFKEVVYKTLQFVAEELTNPSGGFYSSLDADSLDEKGKLKEGAFYTWKKPFLKNLLKDDFEIFSKYYNLNAYGEWENEKYVPIRTKSDEEIASNFNISEKELLQKKEKWRKALKAERGKRHKPRLDTKQLTSWNALMLTGYLDAYKAFEESSFLKMAEKSADFILQNMMKSDFSLYHSHSTGKSNINGYLEDYAFCIEAFLSVYQVNLEEKWLITASKLCETCLQYFYDEKEGLFYFTSSNDRALISRNFEINDNVIPSSNSVMAMNLFKLGKYFGNGEWIEISNKMLLKLEGKIREYPRGASHWMELALNKLYPFYELVITGKNALKNIQKAQSHFLPNLILDGATSANNRPLLKNRFINGKDLFYICEGNTCQLPQETLAKTLEIVDFNKI